jgi:hypothetical protein
MSQAELIQLIRNLADQAKVDQDLCVAIAMKESGCLWPKNSSRYEPDYQYPFQPEVFASRIGISVETELREQKSSWGPMQIMGGVAREVGFNDAIPLLFMPEIGCAFAIKKLKTLIAKFGDETRVIASYNAGSPRYRITGSGQKELVNSQYVDSVTQRLSVLRQIK